MGELTELEQSASYSSQITTTSDGGTSELITPETSSERLALGATANNLQIQLAPNPSSGVVELNISGAYGAASIVVTDLLGQIIYSTTLAVNSMRTAYLPAQLWTSGTYIIVTSCGGQTATQRLIVN